jgi:hypothetical protein
VLNDHTPLANKYCGTRSQCVLVFNDLIDDLPDVKIVISSAWRYMILRGDVTLRGFEMLLKTHGLKVHERIIGCTGPDGRIEDEPDHHDLEAWKTAGLRWRREQILDWVFEHNPMRPATLGKMSRQLNDKLRRQVISRMARYDLQNSQRLAEADGVAG